MDGWRLLPATLALLLPLASSAAPGQERLPVHLCGLTSADEVSAAARLDDILATATLVPGDPVACQGPPASLRAILVDRGPARVAVLLEGPVMSLERLVPWLTGADGALARLQESGRLASFAILLEALLAEYRLTAAAEGLTLDGCPLAPPPPPAPARVQRPRPPPPKPAPPPVVARVEPAPPPAPAPEPEPPPAPEPEPSPAPAVRTPLRGPGGAPVPLDPGAPTSPPVSAEGFAGFRIREPDLAAAEYGAGLRLGGAFAALRFQPGTSWTLEGRPLSVSAVGVELGWLHPLWPGQDARASGRVAVLAERLLVRQLDVDEGASHEALDAGVALGLVVDRRVAGGLWASLGVEGIWLPTAGAVVLEDDAKEQQDWMRVPFNGVGARATLGISWRR